MNKAYITPIGIVNEIFADTGVSVRYNFYKVLEKPSEATFDGVCIIEAHGNYYFYGLSTSKLDECIGRYVETQTIQHEDGVGWYNPGYMHCSDKLSIEEWLKFLYVEVVSIH